MARTLKLIQITDLHLRAEPDAVLHGWDVNRAWRRVRNDAMTRHPDADLWILTGDLVDDESMQGYARLNADLAALQCPILALAGNHDDPRAMQKELTHARVHASMRLGGWRLHALNSHLDHSEAGRLGTAQIARLQTALEADPEPAVIFIHHPPILLGSQWIDSIGLNDRDAFCRMIGTQPGTAAVICGHAHQAFEASIGTAACWGAPSTMRQFLPGASEFALDTGASPGYRVVRLTPDGRGRSHVQRVHEPAGE